jgi:preprotein translocase subunit SecF
MRKQLLAIRAAGGSISGAFAGRVVVLMGVLNSLYIALPIAMSLERRRFCR